MPMVTEPALSKLTETPLESVGPLDTKVLQPIVRLAFSDIGTDLLLASLAENDGRLSCSCLHGYSEGIR